MLLVTDKQTTPVVVVVLRGHIQRPVYYVLIKAQIQAQKSYSSTMLRDNLLTGRAKTRKMTFRDARKNTSYFVPPHREACPSDVEGIKIRYIWTRNASPAIPNHVIHPGSANTKTRQGKKYLHFKVT